MSDAEYWGDEPDEELDTDNCYMYPSGGRWHCGAIGSEDCDLCEFRNMLGERVDPPTASSGGRNGD